jgi:hypothetical protein
MYNARHDAGQRRITNYLANLNYLRGRYGNVVNKLYNVAYKGISRRRSNSLSKSIHRFKKPIRNKRAASIIHQLGNILPRNVLEQVIRRANLLKSRA